MKKPTLTDAFLIEEGLVDAERFNVPTGTVANRSIPMANQTLFNTLRAAHGDRLPQADTVNEAGGVAYRRSPEQALAQFAATGVFGNTFYVDAAEQLDEVLSLATKVDARFLAQAAIFAREKGYLKDFPALIVALLSERDRALFQRVFPRVIDNVKQLRNFVQIMRSGVVGRRSLGTLPRRLVREFLAQRSDATLFRGAVGQKPSLADIIRMVHPHPQSESRRALYGYLLGREHDREHLPQLVKAYEAFKAGERTAVPEVPFQMLDALDIDAATWAGIFRNAGFQFTRMNLNTALRQGVFEVEGMAELIAARLRDREAIRRARVFPYQLLAAATHADDRIPAVVREALHAAMEIAIENVPATDGRVVVAPDVSGSMWRAVTGYRRGATSQVRCVDVAALVAAAVLRMNPQTRVLPFEDEVCPLDLRASDGVLANAAKLSRIGGGGTNVSAPLALLNHERAAVDLVVFVSDNQSWVDTARTQYYGWGSNPTQTMAAWEQLKRRNPQARMVCIDITPSRSVQAREREDILNVGGFSDHVFEVVAAFASGNGRVNAQVEAIRSLEL